MRKEQQKPLTQAEVDAILSDWPADFSGRLLVGIRLSNNRSLECANFRGTVFRDCHISHCKFDNSDFTGADFGDSVFTGCKMEYCHFNGAQMEGASFDRCALFGSAGLNGDTRLQSEVVFDDEMGIIRGIDMACAPAWRQFAREICEADEETYGTMLCELQEKFQEIDNAHPGMGAEIFNSGMHFMPNELLTAAEWIDNGASPEEASEALRGQAELADIHAGHTLWRIGHPDGVRADFTGRTLKNLDFTGMTFDEAIFADTSLYNCWMNEASFTQCDFSKAVFLDSSAIGADFEDAVFDGAALDRSLFQGAHLDGARFAGAALTTCDFQGADMEPADFSQAVIQHCEGLEGMLSGPVMAME